MDKVLSISPGRWAVGYGYLYLLTRILNDIKPKNILDLGLGVSSTIISSYGSYYKDCVKHTIVEHDREWIKFYTNSHPLSDNSNILIKELHMDTQEGIEFYSYSNFDEVIIDNKYDFISIDAPYGGRNFSRRDIIDLIPKVLEDNFVIVIDDYNRFGEKKTISDIKIKLGENKIPFCAGSISSLKDVGLIASSNYQFLTSL